ncbi:glycosyltransferase family 2 protein [Lignipirellula cremea]|uniref:Glycosyltransferase EpsH n=1 Tax=Lignipirellula cremea TaxID=2528010 RepID=A0A518DMJ2_9BACT|nr:glycosyltransferase family A protein [Lignipirellula cremea]QDU93056.1 Putative glycosyltransferase EpsH [Lignipirellula cremea]
MSSPAVTIVLCTYRRAEMLREAATSLLALETQLPANAAESAETFDYEVLIVDNNSPDHTPQVAAELAALSPRVRSIRETNQGVVHARNRGVREARGEWIAFFDDDQLADPRWLVELLTAARSRQVRCVGGAVWLDLPAECDRNLSPMVRMLLGETVGLDSARPYSARFTPGCGNLMLHRSVLDEVGLFDPAFNGRGEDTELFMRMLDAGIAGWCTPQAIVHHRIDAARLEDAFLLRLARTMAVGMAADEHREWGPWRYPLIWLARVGQTGVRLLPAWAAARLMQDQEHLIGARCRLLIARQMLRDGLPLLFRRAPASGSTPSSTITASAES